MKRNEMKKETKAKAEESEKQIKYFAIVFISLVQKDQKTDCLTTKMTNIAVMKTTKQKKQKTGEQDEEKEDK